MEHLAPGSDREEGSALLVQFPYLFDLPLSGLQVEVASVKQHCRTVE